MFAFCFIYFFTIFLFFCFACFLFCLFVLFCCFFRLSFTFNNHPPHRASPRPQRPRSLPTTLPLLLLPSPTHTQGIPLLRFLQPVQSVITLVILVLYIEEKHVRRNLYGLPIGCFYDKNTRPYIHTYIHKKRRKKTDKQVRERQNEREIRETWI